MPRHNGACSPPLKRRNSAYAETRYFAWSARFVLNLFLRSLSVYRRGTTAAGRPKSRMALGIPKKTAERLTLRPYDAVMAGRTAAVALDAGDFHASPYTFIVSRRRQTSREDIRFLHCRLSEIDVMLCDRIPTTSFERTVYDLLRPYEDPDLVDKFMEDAIRKHGHQFDVERLGSLLSPIASRFGYPIGDGISFAASLAARNATISNSRTLRPA